MYIKHLADSVNFKAVTPNKNCNGLTGLLKIPKTINKIY